MQSNVCNVRNVFVCTEKRSDETLVRKLCFLIGGKSTPTLCTALFPHFTRPRSDRSWTKGITPKLGITEDRNICECMS